jgi:hypothetical protein
MINNKYFDQLLLNISTWLTTGRTGQVAPVREKRIDNSLLVFF